MLMYSYCEMLAIMFHSMTYTVFVKKCRCLLSKSSATNISEAVAVVTTCALYVNPHNLNREQLARCETGGDRERR